MIFRQSKEYANEAEKNGSIISKYSALRDTMRSG